MLHLSFTVDTLNVRITTQSLPFKIDFFQANVNDFQPAMCTGSRNNLFADHLVHVFVRVLEVDTTDEDSLSLFPPCQVPLKMLL